MGRNRVWIGVGLSSIYVLAVSGLAVWKWEELTALRLNELGDFLAGAFGPLAILWLVLGYFQQGEELHQNTEALRLQAEELKRSVQQQQALVVVAKEQIAETKQAELDAKFPRFVLTTTTFMNAPEVCSQEIHIRNEGASAANVVLTIPLVGGTSDHQVGLIPRFGEAVVRLDIAKESVILGDTAVQFRVAVSTGNVYLLIYPAKYVPDADGLATLVIKNQPPQIVKT